MWVELFCGLVIYRLFRRFFYDDDILTADSEVLFSVAERIGKLYDGKVYTGLRIPDADTGLRQNIDMVLVTKGEAVVISVQNLSGFVSIDVDGSWVCTAGNSHKTERHADPVADTKRQVAILESYLEQRGTALPEGYLSGKIVCPNPNFCRMDSNYFPREVITYDQWKQLKPEPKSMFSGWIKGAFRTGKKEMQESINQKLNFILSTAPIWDRLELKGNKYILGEFLEFKGKKDDVQALTVIRRSKVGRLIIQKSSMFGIGGATLCRLVGHKMPAFINEYYHSQNTSHSKLQVLYSSRDYRSEGASGSEWKEITVRSNTEVLFRPQNSTKVCKFKLSSFISASLSA